MKHAAGVTDAGVRVDAAHDGVLDVLFDGARVWVYTAVMWTVIVGLWFGRPLLRSAKGESSGP